MYSFYITIHKCSDGKKLFSEIKEKSCSMIDKLPDGSTIVYCRLELEEGLKVVEKCGEYGTVELTMSKEGGV